ncbi:MAG TPA: hypothetical protein DCP51_05825 [Clostridiales bacterium]|nr:hypothetical protein [Clostridiales bacterium]HCT85384.1 hypothetical protein [Candidatus Margulisiibacteriota bacterium]
MSTDIYLKYSNTDIGKHIVELRKLRNISAYKLSLDSCISNSVLIRIEKGEREAKINTLLKIIEGLGISPAEFFKDFK